MPFVARARVIPLHGQVVITDSEARDYPQWQTGQEKAVALPNSVAVATRADREGDVTIEVWGDKLEGEEELELAYKGELGKGRYHLKVFTASSATLPDRVYFVVTRLA